MCPITRNDDCTLPRARCVRFEPQAHWRRAEPQSMRQRGYDWKRMAIPKRWQSYEDVATCLLHRNAQKFGLDRVEGRQEVSGNRSGTTYKIEAKGVAKGEKEGGEAFVIVECRRYTASKQNQDRLGGLAYRILDTGAAGGIVVSPLGFQKGAAKIADAENIIEVQLDANATPNEFMLKFLNNLILGVRGASMTTTGLPVSVRLEQNCSHCGARFITSENELICPSCRVKDK
jgi:hypothetical protein